MTQPTHDLPQHFSGLFAKNDILWQTTAMLPLRKAIAASFLLCLLSTELSAQAATPTPGAELTRLGIEFSELYLRSERDRMTRHGDSDRNVTTRMQELIQEANAIIRTARSEILIDLEIHALRRAIATRAPVPYRDSLLADQGKTSPAWIAMVQLSEFLGLLSLGALDAPMTWIAPAAGLASIAVTYLGIHPLVRFKINAYHYPLLQTAQFLRKRKLAKLLRSETARIANGEYFLRELTKAQIPLRAISLCENALLTAIDRRID